MKLSQANKILKVLDRINAEVDLLGKIIFPQNSKPVAVPVRVNDRFKLKK